RAEGGVRGRERAARRRPRDAGDHPLPAAAQPYRARRGARVLGWPRGRVRGQGPGARARGARLRRLRRGEGGVSVIPVRLGAAETKLIEQLTAVGASAEAERLAAIGLPTRRVESYHYTDLKQLLRAVPELAGDPLAAADVAVTPSALSVAGAFRLVIANGHVQKHGTAPGGVIVGQSKGGVLTTRDDIVTRLNGAFATDALTLELTGSVEPVIQIDRRIEGQAGHSASAARIFVGDGGSAVIL